MRAVKDSPVTRLFRNSLRTSGGEAGKIRTSEIMKRAVSARGAAGPFFLLAEEGMEANDLLCSRNARPQKALVGRAQWKINQPPSLNADPHKMP